MRSLSITAVGSDTDRLSLAVSNLQLSLMDSKSAEKDSHFSLAHFFRPYSKNILSLLVCLSLIPVLIFFSLSAGFLVWRNIAVGWEVPLYLQYGDGVQPYARALLPPLDARQPYNVVLSLRVPATESNFELGNFMNSLTIMTSNNKTIAAVRRPAIAISPRSSYFSSRPNVVNIEIPMLSSFIPGTAQVEAEVHIGRQDSWKGVGAGIGRELSVVSASLSGTVVHQRIRGLITRFPNISPLFAAALFFAILFSILSAFMLPSILQKSPSGDKNQTSHYSDDKQAFPPGSIRKTSESSSEAGEREVEMPIPSRRRRRKRTSSQESSVKTESDSVTIPSADEAMPLRRLRSRPSDIDS